MLAEESGSAAADGDAGHAGGKPESSWRRLFGSQWTITLAGGLIVTVAGGLLVYFLTAAHKPSPPAPSAPLIPAGYYVSGQPGTPHWFMLISSSHGAAISGTLAFVGQDGQTGLAQTFSGSISQGLASLNFSHAGVRTATVDARSRPPTIDLGACTGYLQFVTSLPECSFRHATDIQGDQAAS